MLLKSCQSTQLPGKRKGTSNQKQQQPLITATMKMAGTGAAGMPIPRIQRKVVRVASKRNASGKRLALPVEAFDPCDSSSDSGLGLDLVSPSDQAKRKRVEIKMESDDANDNFAFEEAINRAKRDPHKAAAQLLLSAAPRVPPGCPRRRAAAPPSPALLVSHLLGGMNPHKPQYLQMVSQPEQQHRARYQTEGSRGAVKDRTGNSFPTVKLVGYSGPATLQVFIGSDLGRVVPHMFYQACRVSGKNSTPCTEKVIDGTVVIEIDVEPAKDMVVTCDCVGILKERNVDVEHRFPDQAASRTSKKKSTRCRMVFRALIPEPDGTTRTLEVTSQPIVCTQPPGVPEICKKSLQSAPCTGGQELFILGKNFLKDTRVTFASTEATPLWQVSVQPDKEYLQQSHLVCLVPAYARTDITAGVTICVSVTSSGKTSEAHTFQYMPLQPPLQQPTLPTQQQQVGLRTEVQSFGNAVQSGIKLATASAEPLGLLRAGLLRPVKTQYLLVQATQGDGKESVFIWKPTLPSTDQKLMPPPIASSPHSPPEKILAVQIQGIDLSVAPPTTDSSLLETTLLDKRVPTSPKSGCTLIQHCSPEVPATNPPMATTTADLSSYTQHYSTEHNLPTELSMAVVTNSVPITVPVETTISSTTEVNFSASTKEFKSDILPTAVTVPMATGADLSSTQSPSLDTLRRFVSPNHLSAPLPSLSVEKFLSGLDSSDKKNELKAESDNKSPYVLFTESTIQPALHDEKCYQDKDVSASCGNLALPSTLDKDLQYRSQQDTTHPDVADAFQMQANTALAKPFVSEASDRAVLPSFNPGAALNNCALLTNGECVSNVYDNQVSQAHIMLHCQPLSTTTVTMATAPDYHGNATTSGHLESSRISAAQNARLDALVCSAMSTNPVEPNSVMLDGLVSSALNPPRQLSEPHPTILETLINSTAENLLFVAREDALGSVATTGGDSLPLPAVPNAASPHGEFSLESSLVTSTSLPLRALNRHVITSMSGSSLEQNVVGCHGGSVLPLDSALFHTDTSSHESVYVGGSSVEMSVAPSHLASPGLSSSDVSSNAASPCTSVEMEILSGSRKLLSSTITVENVLQSSATSELNNRSASAMFDLTAPSPTGIKSMMITEQLITAETVCLDAFVTSALDNHSSSRLEVQAPVLMEYPLLSSMTKSPVPQYNLAPHSVANDSNMMIQLNSDAGKIQLDEPQYSPGRSSVADSNLISGLNSDSDKVELDVPHYSLGSNSAANNSNLLLRLSSDSNKIHSDVSHYSVGPINVATHDNLMLRVSSDTEKANSEVRQQQKREEGMVSRELTQMSESDLISYINPSCFDIV